MEREARELFERLGTPISPRARVGDLRIGDQQMVEIAKALMFSCEILIMDEPTSALSDAEVARLYRVIDDLRKGGTTILYISHKMNEVFTLSDARDRAPRRPVRGDLDASPDRAAQVVRWMVGREIAALHFEPKEVTGRASACGSRTWAWRARRTAAGRTSRGSRSTCTRARSWASPGLLGAGRTELLESLFGASASLPTGSITLDGRSGAVPLAGRGDRGGRGAGDRGPQEPRPVRPDERRPRTSRSAAWAR